MNARGRIPAASLRQMLADGVISVPAAAKRLGVAAPTVRRLIAAGLLSSARVGSRVVVPARACDDYLASTMSLGSIA